MGFYGRYVFPHLMERTFAAAGVEPLRREALADARGEVLELGFGTGLNLIAYPPTVERVVAVDRQAPGLRFVRERISQSRIPVEFRQADAVRLPFEDASFDTVATTWTLCSLDGVEQALGELRRVLRPDGRYLFLEHGLNPEPAVQRAQHRWAPITRFFGAGCRPDRAIAKLIEGAGFRFETLRNLRVERLGKVSGYLYMGDARTA